MSDPQSRNEAILRSIIDGTQYTAPPRSRIEDLLLELKTAIENGELGFTAEVVDTLPSTGEKNTIYLVPNSGTTPNIYDEYIYVDSAWEKIGTTEIDMTQYYTKTEADALLAGKADTATTLSGYGITDAYTSTEVDSLLSAKADADAVNTKISTAQAHSLTPTGEGKGFVKHIYGMSEQDGTPTPSDPVLIEDSLGNFTVTDSDATNTQTITTNITLRAIEVTSSDSYNLEYNGKYYIADSIDWVDGTGYVLTRRIGTVSISSIGSVGSKTSYGIVSSSDFDVTQYVLTISNTYLNLLQSDYFQNGVYDDFLNNDGYMYVNTGNRLSLRNDTMTSLADWNTWLASNPVTVYAVLVTPTTSTLTTSQMTALLGLVTYDEATNITPTAEPYPVSAVEYGESRVAALALSNHNEIEILKL